jgi:hypothetical protein
MIEGILGVAIVVAGVVLTIGALYVAVGLLGAGAGAVLNAADKQIKKGEHPLGSWTVMLGVSGAIFILWILGHLV